jgi:hypothetical protein
MTAPAAEAELDPAGEERAWAAVVTAWADEAAHRAYLSRFGDLDGLTRAGRRYRAVLAERPGDPLAIRFRDEVVKRATVQGLALLPRTAPPPALPRWAKGVLVALLGSLLATLAWKTFTLFTRAPVP